MTRFPVNWYTSRAIRPLATLALISVLAACTGYHPAPVARRGGTLVVALGQDAQTLNPLVAGDVWSVRAYTPLYPQLYELGDDLQVQPSLAAMLPQISADGLTWTVRLRSARWSDRKPITADDVVYTVQTEISSTLDTRAAFDWSPLQRVEKVDAHTVAFHLTRPDGRFLADRLLAAIVPQHALGGTALGSMSTAIFSTQPTIAGGPFQLIRRQPGFSLELGANSQYFGPKPYFDAVVMEVITDQNELETQIAQGNVTWAPDIPASVAARLRGVPGVSIRSFPEQGRFSLVFNTRAGRPFADASARTAARSALDVAKIAAAAGGVAANALPAAGPAASSVKSGRLLIPLGDAARAAAAAELAREVAARGVTLSVEAVPPQDFTDRLRSGDFDAALAGLGTALDPDPAATVASWETPATDPHGENFAGLDDPRLDALVKQDLALTPWDRTARDPLLRQISDRIAQDAPFVDLWTVDELDAFGASLVGAGRAGPYLDQDLQSSFYARWSLAA